MMSLLILRPLIWSLIEYALAIYVYKKGRFIPKIISLFLVFLSTYQLGEFLFFSTGDSFWLRISLFSTTMLPPFGFWIIEHLSKQKSFYKLFFVASTILGTAFVVIPGMLPAARECNCFAKYDSSVLQGINSDIYNVWSWYYSFSLILAMLMIMWHIRYKNGDTKALKLLLIAYITFFPFSYIIALFYVGDLALVASIMCSLAIITAFIVTYISSKGHLFKDLKALRNHTEISTK